MQSKTIILFSELVIHFVKFNLYLKIIKVMTSLTLKSLI